jgi:hypothetical protein
MAGAPDDTLHEVTEIAVIQHRDRGVLLVYSDDRRWHFPDSTVRVGQRWDASLRQAVRSATGIEDLTIGPVLLIQNFGPGEVDVRPQFGLFFLCGTRTRDVIGALSHRWITDPSELKGMELFHPLVADLIRRVLREDEPRPDGPGLIP